MLQTLASNSQLYTSTRVSTGADQNYHLCSTCPVSCAPSLIFSHFNHPTGLPVFMDSIFIHAHCRQHGHLITISGLEAWPLPCPIPILPPTPGIFPMGKWSLVTHCPRQHPSSASPARSQFQARSTLICPRTLYLEYSPPPYTGSSLSHQPGLRPS